MGSSVTLKDPGIQRRYKFWPQQRIYEVFYPFFAQLAESSLQIINWNRMEFIFWALKLRTQMNSYRLMMGLRNSILPPSLLPVFLSHSLNLPPSLPFFFL